MVQVFRGDLEEQFVLRGHIGLDEAVVYPGILDCLLVFVLFLNLGGVDLFHFAFLALLRFHRLFLCSFRPYGCDQQDSACCGQKLS